MSVELGLTRFNEHLVCLLLLIITTLNYERIWSFSLQAGEEKLKQKLREFSHGIIKSQTFRLGT